jgi:hypothetical protein
MNGPGVKSSIKPSVREDIARTVCCFFPEYALGRRVVGGAGKIEIALPRSVANEEIIQMPCFGCFVAASPKAMPVDLHSSRN